MYSFEGNFRTKPEQNLAGASKKVNIGLSLFVLIIEIELILMFSTLITTVNQRGIDFEEN